MPLIPIEWLASHVEVPADLTPEQLAADLVRVGLEEEAIHEAEVTGPVVVGKVLTLEAKEQSNGKGWSMEILYSDDPTPLPRRLNLAHSNGKRAIVLIKEREKVTQPFTKEQMALPLPDDAPLLPLAKFKQQQ